MLKGIQKQASDVENVESFMLSAYGYTLTVSISFCRVEKIIIIPCASETEEQVKTDRVGDCKIMYKRDNVERSCEIRLVARCD